MAQRYKEDSGHETSRAGGLHQLLADGTDRLYGGIDMKQVIFWYGLLLAAYTGMAMWVFISILNS